MSLRKSGRKSVAIFTMAHPKPFPLSLLGSALALTVLVPAELALARPSAPPAGSPTPVAPTTPLPPRPSTSSVAGNAGAFAAFSLTTSPDPTPSVTTTPANTSATTKTTQPRGFMRSTSSDP